MIHVLADGLLSGLLARAEPRAATFRYDADAAAHQAVSVTMPVRLASWNQPAGLHPIFEMNLPEGALRERLRLRFAKATGTFDDFDLLGIVGRSQVGRLCCATPDAGAEHEVPFQSVDEILRSRRDGGLFDHLLETFATHSGVSGVQPKVLIRDTRHAASVRGATHMVKFWERDFPELAANEFFCLRAAELAGLSVPRFRLAEDGAALVVDRFDLRLDGSYRGFEDFGVLNGRGTAEKYRGGYETALFKRLHDFVPGEAFAAEAQRLFTLFALCCALRNGDAHLKNFGVLYDDVTGGEVALAPAYDLVTTTAYLPRDGLALTLNGSTRWPTARELTALGQTRCRLAPSAIRLIFERLADAMTDAALELDAYATEHREFQPVAGAMLGAWREGLEHSLGALSARPGRPPAA